LLYSICWYNIIISIFFKLFFFIRYLLLFTYYSNTFTSIQCFICYLTLKREEFHIYQINILHFSKNWYFLQSIFKCYFSIFCNISKISCE
jgi:hypothetical protein